MSYSKAGTTNFHRGCGHGAPCYYNTANRISAVVEENSTGLLCDVKNAQILAGAAKRFLALSPEAQADMGRAGREKMARDYDQAILLRADLAAMATLCGTKVNGQPAAGA